MSDQGDVKGQRRGAESRQALLQAGVELLEQETLSDLVHALSARAVAKQATRSTGSFFHHWASAEDYLNDLIAFVFGSGLLPEIVDEVTTDLDHLLGGSNDPVGVIASICRADFDHTVGSPFFPVELLLRSRPNDERIADGLRAFYHETDESLKSAYEAVISSWQLEPRPPFTYDSIAVLFTALLEGLAIRHLIDSECVPPDLFGQGVLGLLVGMLQRPESREHLDDRANRLVSGDT
jgi:AcrR family transcriptional regulator